MTTGRAFLGLLDAQGRGEGDCRFQLLWRRFESRAKVEQQDESGLTILLVFADHERRVACRAAPVNCASIVTRAVFANAVKFIVLKSLTRRRGSL
jgi:hypothetical protein